MNATILNNVAAFLQSQGIKMEVNEATKNAVIGLCITTMVETGVSIEAATDLILGAGTFRKIADDVWAINNA